MKKDKIDIKENGKKRRKIEGDDEVDYSKSPHQGILDPLLTHIYDAFKMLKESKMKKEYFPNYKFDIELVSKWTAIQHFYLESLWRVSADKSHQRGKEQQPV